MIPVFRSLISVPAGIERMSFGAFVLLTTAGSLIWNTIFVLAGYYLGENWHVAEQYAGIFSRIVVVTVAALLAWWVLKRVLRNRRGLSDAARRERGQL
jgi:membrane protein DedA with SNARE-associated domain